ncbi:hypothetical protein BSFA1_68340 (plasmid) [Burkholderia sp. SFA1]|uniref:hypothetical protein n=1 Tax=unclassified Caballeronia TaxID=2646786 RepID=UPI001F20053A|nr:MULTISPECIES: hypothetical protein [unclassified Caballeronia]MCE4546611.1 hypothetical protein [Caballeronia sp. PC1]MCE4572916.1 hypothetical protein [Caballeronia sp. CLC5]BBQ01706.1 hypothetical protein BSFA1_68340 [Burkholderia sp. SFA1]
MEEKSGQTAPDDCPDADEAWVIALPARDERETAVWTSAIAQAWAIARPVLEADKILPALTLRDARKSFPPPFARHVCKSHTRYRMGAARAR